MWQLNDTFCLFPMDTTFGLTLWMLHFPGTTVSYAKTLHTNILIYQCSALQQVIRSKSCESCYWHFFSLWEFLVWSACDLEWLPSDVHPFSWALDLSLYSFSSCCSLNEYYIVWLVCKPYLVLNDIVTVSSLLEMRQKLRLQVFVELFWLRV
jgi:hypothetical protein